MTYILFALIFVQIVLFLVGGWYLKRHLEKIEESLGALDAMRFMPDQLQHLVKEVESLEMSEIRSRLDDFYIALTRVEDLAATQNYSDNDSEAFEEQLVRAMTVRHLLAQGFRDVVFQSFPEDFDGDSAELSILAKRDGAQYSGTIKIDKNEIVSQNLNPNFTSFP